MSEPLSISSAAAFPRSRISHNAYWQVKEQCKRSGKPCLYMKHGGVAGLSRLIAPGKGNKTAKPLPVVQN